MFQRTDRGPTGGPSGRRRWQRGGPPWAKGERPRFIFLRFATIFGLIALLLAGGLGVLSFLLSRAFGGNDTHMARAVWLGGCGLVIALPLFALFLASRAFRQIALPLGDLMTAADAVARGDLSVRVPAHSRGAFGRLAESFNHMTTELERADQQRRNLTADVAHELRTPLHIIQGNLEGVLDRVYEPTDEHIRATLGETRALARLVDDLRTLSLAEAGQLPLERETVDIRELLLDVATSFSGQAEAAGIVLRVEGGEETLNPSPNKGGGPDSWGEALNPSLTPSPSKEGGRERSSPSSLVGKGDGGLGPSALTVTGDAGRLDQVLSNLLANALRHTPAGGSITLRAEALATGGVRLTVRDSGEGIPASDLPFIFDRFWRGDPSRSHARGVGSGLGLPIARQLIQAHGGRIEVQSEVGQGTTFTIEIPNRPAD